MKDIKEKTVRGGAARLIGQALKSLLRLGTIIALMWAGLQKHHPDMSEEDVAMLLDDMDGGATAAMSHIDDAFARAFNAPGTKGTNPRQANGSGAGTTPSSSTQATATIPISSGT